MHFNKKLLISALLVLMLVSISAVSAEEIVTDDSSEIVTQSVDISDDVVTADDNEIIEENVDDELVSNSENNEVLSDDIEENVVNDDCRVIYVGQNITEDGGNGTFENPFSTLNLACANSSGENKLTVNILSGTYFLDSHLKFNASNLIIHGDGNVIIKAGDPTNFVIRALGLTDDNANFTMNNIIFDGLEITRSFAINRGQVKRYNAFLPLYPNANLGKFNNCTFMFSLFLYGAYSFNSIFSNCTFFRDDSYLFYDSTSPTKKYTIFDNCIFKGGTLEKFFSSYKVNVTNLTVNNCWFGNNNPYDLLHPPHASVTNPDNGNYYDGQYEIPSNRYAIFSATENYLGNNTYEIIGKLTWNGTEDQDGMENFQPMTVKLQSTTGNISETAVLKDGTFRAIYTSNSPNNYVSATLDNEEVELEFTNIDLLLNAPAIKYGEDQNITITLPQSMSTTVTLLINNKTYDVVFEDTDSVTFTIEDILAEGNYTVNATIDKDGVHALNSTVLSVSKVKEYDFNVIIPTGVTYGDVPVLEIELPEDATGNVSIVVNNKTYSVAAGKTVSIPVDNLVAGDNSVVATYSSDKYAELSKEDIITVEKASASISAENINLVNENCSEYSITLTDGSGNPLAGEVVIVKINNETREVTTDENGVAKLDLNLGAGVYSVNVSLNSNFDEVSKEATISVVYDSSIKILSIDGSRMEVTAVLKDVNGNPIANATVSYALNNGDKVNVTSDDEGLLIIKVSNNCVVDITFEGTDSYNPSDASITLKNIAPTPKGTTITVDKTFTRTAVDFPAGEKGYMFYFTLKDETGKVLANKEAKIGVSGKIYTVKTDKNGKAGLMINLANANVYTYAISFLGDDDYKASFAVSKLTVVKKAVTITPAKTSYTFKSAAKSKVITATLKSTNKFIPAGKKVTLTVGGKTYSAVVAKNGKISLNIAKLTKKGTYKVTIKYAGDGTYKAAASKTITVKIN